MLCGSNELVDGEQSSLQKAVHSILLLSEVELCSAVFGARKMSIVIGKRGRVVADWLRLMPLTTYCGSASCVGSAWLCFMWWRRIELKYSLIVECLTEVERCAQK